MNRCVLLVLAGLAIASSPGIASPFDRSDRPSLLGTVLDDAVIPGFRIEARRNIGLYDAYSTLSNGDRVVFDGLSVDLVTDDGFLRAHLGSVPQFVFPSFVRPDPTETFAVIGESSNGDIFRVDLGGAGQSPITNLYFHYDAVWEDASHILVSAAPCGFHCGSEVYRIDVQTGAQTLVASITGASGPLARDGNGDLYYGLQPAQSFPPPGSWSILRWTQGEVSGGSVLDVTDADVFAAGREGAASLRFDAVYGHLFLAESVFLPSGQIGGSSVVEFDRAGNQVARVVSSDHWISSVEFLYGPGPGSFQAFQPANGVTMKYRSTDYTRLRSRILTVRPRRPRSWTSGPGLSGPGPVTLHMEGAQPGANFLVLMGHAASYSPSESTYDQGNFLFHTGIPLHDIRELLTVPTDAHGNGSWSFQNPGGLEGTRVFQAKIRDSAGSFIGSSTAAFN